MDNISFIQKIYDFCGEEVDWEYSIDGVEFTHNGRSYYIAKDGIIREIPLKTIANNL